MGRLGLSARLLAIGVSALLVLWLVILAAYYKNNGGSDHVSSPARLAAMVRLFSRTDAADRAALAEALSEPTLSLSLAIAGAGLPMPGSTARGVDLTDRPEFAAHRAQLGDSLVSIRAREGRVMRPLLLRFGGTGFLPLAYVLRLQDGAILVVEGRLAPGFNLFGLPVGLGAGLAGTLIGLLVLLLVQREIRPLLTLSRAADRMDPAGPPIPLPSVIGRTREVKSLIEAFGRLQDRLQLLMTSRLALLSGVQHDVRSFATRLRLRVEAIPDPAERGRAVKDIEDMIRLLDDALVSARAGSGSLDEELIELGEWVTTEVADLGRNGVPVTLSGLPSTPIEILADRVALKRILGNLVDNAIKYGQRAEVTLVRTGQAGVLVVRDDGPGIPADMRGLLLEPFTRGEPSRARQTGGAGLGLAIVQTLARAHGGTIEIGDAPGGGAEVRVSLPLFEAQASDG